MKLHSVFTWASGRLPTLKIVLSRHGVPELLVAQALPLVSSLAMLFITARLLGPSARGELAFVVAAATFIATTAYADLHVGAVLVERTHAVGSLRLGLRIVGVVAALLATGGAIAWVYFEDRLLAVPTTNTGLLLVAIGAAVMVLSLYVTRVAQAMGDATTYRRSAAVQAVLFLLLGAAATIVWRDPIAVIAAWGIALAASALVAVPSFVRASTKVAVGSKWRLMVSSSLTAAAGATGQRFLLRADILILGFFVPAASLGAYSIASPLAGLLWLPSEALALAAFASGVGVDSSHVKRRVRQFVRLYAVIGLAAAGAVVLLAVIVPVWLSGYESITLLTLLLVPGVFVHGFARIVMSFMIASGDHVGPVVIGSASVALSVLYVPAILWWGTIGAAAASSVIYSMQTALVCVAYRRRASRVLEMMGAV